MKSQHKTAKIQKAKVCEQRLRRGLNLEVQIGLNSIVNVLFNFAKLNPATFQQISLGRGGGEEDGHDGVRIDLFWGVSRPDFVSCRPFPRARYMIL